MIQLARKKLIEVSIPLETINRESAREKSIRHGHPSTLHLWWARRPLAACRAVLFAQLVDDPGSCPKEFPTIEKQNAERDRLHRLIERLVPWESSTNETILNEARYEIARSVARGQGETLLPLKQIKPQEIIDYLQANAPPVYDPFSGGGSIPLEAQRLGLRAMGSDLNPVAVLIGKALVEFPPKFANRKPVNPDADELRHYRGAEGLAEDVRYYGRWMRDEAIKKIGHLYPKVKLKDGSEATVIAWLWARTVASPDPRAKGVHVPLASSFVLSAKKNKEVIVTPVVDRTNMTWAFEVKEKPSAVEVEAAKKGTKAARGANFVCLLTGSAIDDRHVKTEARAGRMSAELMAIVAEGLRGRIYVAPRGDHVEAALSANRPDVPEIEQPVPERLTGGTCYGYGLDRFDKLFTSRQLVALTTFSDLVMKAREKVLADALRAPFLGARASGPHPRETHVFPEALSKWHSRGYLPHWEAGEVAQTLTFRLADSLPHELLDHWRDELARLPEKAQQTERRRRIEAALDAGHGASHMRAPEIARLVEDALLHFDGSRYHLHAWVVMPNHVHVLITPLHANSLSSIVQSWKSFTAKEANKRLGREGTFWQAEYFDRAIRDETHFANAVAYIEGNPVSAGLCAKPEGWAFSSACERREERAGRPRSQDDKPLADGGLGPVAYADTVATLLSFLVSRLADRGSSICSWDLREGQGRKPGIRNVFSRQAIPMTWDYAEANPLSEIAASLQTAIMRVADTLDRTPALTSAIFDNRDAAANSFATTAVFSTDPPYYDNIGYADLSDFFYVWLRRALHGIHPQLFRRVLTPKAEELVATPYRHGGREQAEKFFLDGMKKALAGLAKAAADAPVTIYYAYKQKESEGWTTFLQAVLDSGLAVDATWPLRSELSNRMIASGTNALDSSIVHVCRRRDHFAASITRADFLRALRREMPDALAEIRRAGVGPTDIQQATIGPGIGIFTRYSQVLNTDGTPMLVKDALKLINQVREEISSDQDGDYDSETRFALDWFAAHGFGKGDSGDAIIMTNAVNISLNGMNAAGFFEARGGDARLLKRGELPKNWDPAKDNRATVWEACQHLIKRLTAEDGGIDAAARLYNRLGRLAEPAHALARRLYDICEQKQWHAEGYAYNHLFQEWAAIERRSAEIESQGRLL